jgi:ribosomal-protein-alanine N-acetyltransferase
VEPVVIASDRFLLRPLEEADATDRYWSWLQDARVRTYITAAAQAAGREELRRYIAERSDRDDVLFLGIFDKASGLHIGNIKYEPVNSPAGYAVMGILIGDPSFRGKRVSGEVLAATGQWLRERRGIREIVLGVHVDNHAAIRAYERAGFVLEDSPHVPPRQPGELAMVWRM